MVEEAKEQPLNVDDLFRLVIPSDPVVHPDGKTIAYVRTRLDEKADRNHQEIWLAADGAVRRFTAGPGDTKPRWSPDGTRLAFLRTREGVKQAAVIPADGGEATIVTDFELGVEDLVWTPDGRRLIVVAVTWTPEWENLDPSERSRRPRRIRFVPYRFDNQGRLDDRRRHLWLIDPDAEPRCLTPGDFDETNPAVSPDGTKVAYVTKRDPRRGLVFGTEVWETDVATGQERRVAPLGKWTLPTYRPDGVLHLVGHPEPVHPTVEGMYRCETDGDLTDLTGHLDRSLVSLAAGQPKVAWDGQDAYVGLEDSGTFRLVRVSPEGRVDEVVGGRRVVSGFDVGAGFVAFTATTPVNPGGLYGLTEQGEVSLDEPNRDVQLTEPEHFTVISDGWEIDAWVYLPPGTDRVPVLLNIHGGPASQYGFGFFDEFQVYVGAGFGVVAANPRGSSGKGLDFVRAVTGDGWGRVDLTDLRAVLDAALQRFPRLDPDRMGVMGGSYGGFLTAWVTAHDRRFRSAVVERALLSYSSFFGTSDIGPTFTRHYTGAGYPEGWAAWWEKSPLAYAHRVHTPTLIIHSENDFRCPIEQAEQYFTALLHNGVEVELVRFPDEGHELSRSGSPRHRRERFQMILEWHRRHLQNAGAANVG